MRIRRAARSLACLGLVVGLTGLPPSMAAAQVGSSTSATAKPSAAPKPPEAVHHAAAPKAAAPHSPKPAAPAPKPTKASSKPLPKAAAAAAKPKKGGPKRLPRKPGAEAGEPDEASRRIVAGTGRMPRESAELRAMRELDLALFPSMAPTPGAPWIAEGTPLIDRGEPRLQATGLPPSQPITAAPVTDAPGDLTWLRNLTMPDIPIRWDARIVRYLDYYKNNARGRSMVASWMRRSGRYGASIRKILREKGLPEDILWLALVESGFDPTIQSPAGAAGLWQFMPYGARIYGLTVDRWVDERLDPERATVAAAYYLSDLRQRFGNWELAFAAYNMGYGGLLASIRKYNSNDFWELSHLESGVPYETALYVPKILAMAIVSRNRAVFGCEDVELDPAVSFDKIAVGSGVSLRSVALAAGAPVDSVEELNPQLLASRAPPLGPNAKGDASWTVRVPAGAAQRAAKSLAKFTDAEPKLERYRVRWGETLDDIAARGRTTRATLMSLNGVRRDEPIRPGTVIFVPAAAGIGVAAAADVAEVSAPAGAKPVVVVAAQAFATPDRPRVFYRVVSGDTPHEIATLFSVTTDEVCRWNAVDPAATMHDGMTLQVFPPKGYDFRNVVVLREQDARVIEAGSPEFFTHFEGQRGRKRVELITKEGDTWKSLATRYGLTLGQMERINQRARSSGLSAGEKVVVYVSSGRTVDTGPAREAAPEERTDEAQAVASPASDAAAGAGTEDGVTPAVLRQRPEDGAAPTDGVGVQEKKKGPRDSAL